MQHDRRFWIILIIIIAVIVVLTILYTTGFKILPEQPQPLPRPPPSCPVPAAVTNPQANIILGEGGGTIVAWNPSAGATSYCVYKGNSDVTVDNYEEKQTVTDTSTFFNCQVGKYYFICPLNSCGRGSCSVVTFSGV